MHIFMPVLIVNLILFALVAVLAIRLDRSVVRRERGHY